MGDGGRVRIAIMYVDYPGLGPPGGMCSEMGGGAFWMLANLNDTLIYLSKLIANNFAETVYG